MTLGLSMIDSCWIPTQKPKSDGYVQIRMYGESNKYLHRWVYETLVGEIEQGMFLDHLCRERSCCNPTHLEQVTNRENIRRGRNYFRERTSCLKGHSYTEENTYYYNNKGRKARICRKCHHLAQKRYETRLQHV